MTTTDRQAELAALAQAEISWKPIHDSKLESGYALSVRYGATSRLFEVVATGGDKTEVERFKASTLYVADDFDVARLSETDEGKINRIITTLGKRLPKFEPGAAA
ncbi:MAG: hypothetical protein GC136_07735 [Alphaproteobacteria bacterium]|nr:hypothetical protein [Alphaproteobacteria bacterium]